jgi:hypothetical protein
MYYKIYEITNQGQYTDINILRFSYNPLTIDQVVNPVSDENILAFLNALKEQAISEEACYNSIYPWNNIHQGFKQNKEIIIAYNNKTNHIQGWCNLQINKFDNFFTLTIDKLVSRDKPKIKYIGLLLLEFIRDKCVNEPIFYYNNDYKDRTQPYYNTFYLININVMYLYSLTTSIEFYKKTFLTQMQKVIKTHNDHNILQHVFTYINEKYLHTIRDRQIINLQMLEILHTFECNSVMSPSSIETYNSYTSPDSCLNNTNSIFQVLANNDYYTINRLFGKRQRKIINYDLDIDVDVDIDERCKKRK